jgi:hypothetical protein
MDDWKLIWNSFCDEIAASAQKNNLEKVFEEDIARDFFTTLGWNRFKKELKEQYPVKFATATHRADFALFVLGKGTPEVIIELKRPTKKKEEKDANQLIDYMRQEACSYGILLLGNKLEIYYIDYSTPKHEATLVEAIKYQHDNEAAHQLMEVLVRSDYSSAKMLGFCHKRVKVNKSVEYWCSEDGKTEILNMIVERSKLPDHLLETLRSTLVVDVRRKDGLNPVVLQTVATPAVPSKVANSKQPKAESKRDPKVWMISASGKFFDHRRCFDELGYIYWKQYNNLQVGDTGYIYFSKPKQEIVFKFEIIACDLPYTQDYDAEKKYYKREEDFESAKKHNRFYKIKRIGESMSGKLKLSNMLQNGLKQAPLGALNLSDASFEQLLAYIEQNF